MLEQPSADRKVSWRHPSSATATEGYQHLLSPENRSFEVAEERSPDQASLLQLLPRIRVKVQS
jgi:hypothetical protein